MKATKALIFNESDIKTMTEFRAKIFNPMCNILENHCELCPFNEACSDIENFLDKAIAEKEWCVPIRGE